MNAITHLVALNAALLGAVQAANLAAKELPPGRQRILTRISDELCLFQAAISSDLGEERVPPGSYLHRGEVIHPKHPAWTFADARRCGVDQYLPPNPGPAPEVARDLERIMQEARERQLREELRRDGRLPVPPADAGDEDLADAGDEDLADAGDEDLADG